MSRLTYLSMEDELEREDKGRSVVLVALDSTVESE